jgi:hypothetical protein
MSKLSDIEERYRTLTDTGLDDFIWLINRVKALEAALEFYADKSNWGETIMYDVTILENDTEKIGNFYVGGIRARKALESES